MVSQRMCVVCRQMKPKEELIRLVRHGGGFELDPTFKVQGRGAYICKCADCLSRARKLRAFERSFSGRIDVCVYDKLEEMIDNA